MQNGVGSTAKRICGIEAHARLSWNGIRLYYGGGQLIGTGTLCGSYATAFNAGGVYAGGVRGDAVGSMLLGSFGADGNIGVHGMGGPDLLNEYLMSAQMFVSPTDLDYICPWLLLTRPVVGENALMTSRYGYRIHPLSGEWKYHSGIDIIGSNRILAAHEGEVTFSGWLGDYGYMIEVSNTSAGISTRYAHLRERGVSVGDLVRQGQEIGKMGSTGMTTGIHLHFEMIMNSIWVRNVFYKELIVDPNKYLMQPYKFWR